MRYSGIGRKWWSVVWDVGDGIGALGEMRERSGKIFCEWIEGEGLVGAET